MTQGMGGYQYNAPYTGNATDYGAQVNAESQAQQEYNAQIGNTVTSGGGPQLGGAGYTGPNANNESMSQSLSEDPFGVSSNIGTPYNPTGVYGPAINTAANQANNYNNMAAASLGRGAVQINDPYAQGNARALAGVNSNQNALIAGLQKTAANGQKSLAYQQYKNAVAAGQNAQTAIANSAGAGPGGAGARRMAQEGNGMTAAGSVAGGQLVAQQAQQGAQAQLGTALGQRSTLQNQNYTAAQQQALANANLQQGQTGQNFAAQLGYNTLSAAEQGTQLNALTGASNANLGSQGLGQAQQQVTNAQNAVTTGAITGAAGTGASYAAQVYGANAAPAAAPAASEAQLENPYYQT